MKYTIDDLRGKYVKVGTPECDEFLKACVKLEVTWVGGISAKFVTYNAEFIGISKLIYDPITLGHSREEYWLREGFVPFVPNTNKADSVDATVTLRNYQYTVEDLLGKYVEVGTIACVVFLELCERLNIKWYDGTEASQYKTITNHIAVDIKRCRLVEVPNGIDIFDDYTPFILMGAPTPHAAESSAVKTLESSPDTMTIGEMVDSGQSVFGGRITQCDDVDDTVTQHGERYGLFADGAKYERTLVGLCGTHIKTDVYRVLDAFNTGDPILDHLIKKALCAGLRGHKDKLTDYRNIVESAEKALKLLEQKQNGK